MSGGGLVNQLKKSYSLSDLSDPTNDTNDEIDDVILTDPRLMRRRKAGRSPHRSSSASSASVYFSEVDVVAAGVVEGGRISEVRSIEDISSGYSSGEGLYAHQPLKLQSRDSIASQRTSSLTRARSVRVTRSTVPKKNTGNSDDSDENEVFDTNIIFPNDKMKKLDKLPEKHESSSSETEFFDIPDSKGFQMHGKSFDNKERTSSNNINSDRNENNENNCLKLARDYSSSRKIHSIAAAGYGEDSKVTACKSDSSSLNFNFTKLSTALSSLCPSTVASYLTNIVTDNGECNISQEITLTEIDPPKQVFENAAVKGKLPDSVNLEKNYHKPDILEKIQNINTALPVETVNTTSMTKIPNTDLEITKAAPTKMISDLKADSVADKSADASSKDVSGNTDPAVSSNEVEATKSDTSKTISNLKAEFVAAENADASSKSDITTVSNRIPPKPEVRGGKYKKKLAPLPPLPPKKENVDASPIKATLVLQPGIVRNLSRSAESLNKEIFLNYSPKARRRSRSRNRSPASSSRSSDSNTSNKVGHALSKMLHLPKKVAHLNIPSKVKEKRNSWGEFFNVKKLEDSKVQSKSVINIHKSLETERNQEVKPIQRTGSQISIKSLTDSPLAHRRLKIIRRYVDNDID